MTSVFGGRRAFLGQLGVAAFGATVLHRKTSVANVADESPLLLTSPTPFLVVQRTGFEPRLAHEHAVGGARLGDALVSIQGSVTGEFPERFEYRSERLVDAYGTDVDWQPLEMQQQRRQFSGSARIPAGGWYRLQVRGTLKDGSQITQSVEPFGVGEVLLVAGQSYAAGANDELFRVAETEGRVSAFELATNRWRVAHDPQPAVGDGGTIWPPLGDLLAPLLRVPVGFANAAVGGTSSRQWLPEGPLFENLVKTAKAAGGFRAVLWQQGESDVIENTSTEQYVANLLKIRAAFEKQIGSQAPWLLAKSTLHPTVYNEPAGEERIRAAIDQLQRLPGFAVGPDTDLLGAENRGGPDTRRHFSPIGQRRAAQLWFACIWQLLAQGGPAAAST